MHASPALLATLPLLAFAHHQGGSDTDCWILDSDALCKRPPAVIAFQSVPDLITSASNATIFQDSSFQVLSSLALAPGFSVTSSPVVLHWNLHSCRVDLGWCTPDARKQPGLVSQTDPRQGNGFEFNDTVSALSSGQWNVIAHYEFAGRFADEHNDTAYSVAAGFTLRVCERAEELKVPPQVVGFLTALAWLGLLVALFIVGFILGHRRHFVLRAASPALSAFAASGCALGFVSVFVFLPPGSDADCAARPFLLPMAYDALFVPLALKTWRVAALFDNKQFRRHRITDASLFVVTSAALLGDLVLAVAWQTTAPLGVHIIPTSANPQVVFMKQCSSALQAEWQVSLVVLHLLPLVWVAHMARKVRLTFARRRASSAGSNRLNSALDAKNELRMAHFNESESVSLALVSLLFVSIFAVALQFAVTDAPTAQTLMVCGGILWSTSFSLAVLFANKLAAVWVLEQDGVTRRPLKSRAPGPAAARGEAANSPSDDLALL
jgi:hypothetical protein